MQDLLLQIWKNCYKAIIIIDMKYNSLIKIGSKKKWHTQENAVILKVLMKQCGQRDYLWSLIYSVRRTGCLCEKKKKKLEPISHSIYKN